MESQIHKGFCAPVAIKRHQPEYERSYQDLVGIDEGSSREFLHLLAFYVDDTHIISNVADVYIACFIFPCGPSKALVITAILNRNLGWKTQRRASIVSIGIL